MHAMETTPPNLVLQPTRREAIGAVAAMGLSGLASCARHTSTRSASTSSSGRLGYTIELTSPARHFVNGQSWIHARCGRVPGAGHNGNCAVVLTMNSFGAHGSDVFPGVLTMRTNDLGKTWSTPRHARNLAPRLEPIGDKPLVPVAASDFYPAFHETSGLLLNIGHTVTYDRGDLNRWLLRPYRERHSVYATYDARIDEWSPWQRMHMPEDPQRRFYHAGAGCVQRYDLPDGSILLPVYLIPPDSPNARTVVVRCTFDGRRMLYQDRGDELGVNEGRGLGEPQLTKFDDEFLLSMRNDLRAYVARSRDGLKFEKPQVWKFDNGAELGSYNTQTHWITHSDGLFLVYTRKSANNDNIPRHRAPLFIAQVDPRRMVVIRETERVIVPNRGAMMGNFGASSITRGESWVTATEEMRNVAPNAEADGSLWVARLRWDRPNRLIATR
jgi:hypothetical protein